jgi:hypothetical protein
VIHRGPVSFPRLFRLIPLLCGIAATGVNASEAPGRFTQWVPVAERAEAGLLRLSSDEAAVLDVMVRREVGARANAGTTPRGRIANSRGASEGSSEVPAERETEKEADSATRPFSDGLSADERRLAGFGKLSAAETAKINALVERYTLGNVARALLAPPKYVARNRLEPVEKTERKTISGSFSLSYGFAKGGYSERTGAMDVTYTDPAGRYSVTVGYSETHVKGGDGRGMYLYDDRRYMPDGRGMYLDGPPYRP